MVSKTTYGNAPAITQTSSVNYIPVDQGIGPCRETSRETGIIYRAESIDIDAPCHSIAPIGRTVGTSHYIDRPKVIKFSVHPFGQNGNPINKHTHSLPAAACPNTTQINCRGELGTIVRNIKVGNQRREITNIPHRIFLEQGGGYHREAPGNVEHFIDLAEHGSRSYHLHFVQLYGTNAIRWNVLYSRGGLQGGHSSPKGDQQQDCKR